jgi:hypothetical protein
MNGPARISRGGMQALGRGIQAVPINNRDRPRVLRYLGAFLEPVHGP